MEIGAFMLHCKSWEKTFDNIETIDPHDYEVPFGISFKGSRNFPGSVRALWFKKKSDRDNAYKEIIAIVSSSGSDLPHINGNNFKGLF